MEESFGLAIPSSVVLSIDSKHLKILMTQDLRTSFMRRSSAKSALSARNKKLTVAQAPLFFAVTICCFVSSAYRTFAQVVDVEVKAPNKISSIKINDVPTSYFELQLVNRSNDSITIEKVIIRNSDQQILMALAGDELSKRTIVKVPPGATSWVYMELPATTKISSITHELELKIGESDPKIIRSKPTTVSTGSPIVVGMPLRGGPWIAIYEPAWARGHRRVVYNGHIPGRYAIDFMKMDNSGKYASGDEDEIKNWYGYNAEVLAVADGVVSSVINDFPESSTIKSHPAVPAERATGNYISIRISDSVYVFYEHLRPGSVRVVPGQKVKRGEVIANVGFTGQTTGPHLHFHLANIDSPLGAEGLPFVFDKFTTIGTYPDFADFGKKTWKPVKRSRRVVKQRPGPNSVVEE